MNKHSKLTSLLLALVMVFTCALSAAPQSAYAAKKVTVKSVTTKSSLSGSKKTLYVAKGKTVKLSTTVKVTPNKKANKKVTYKSANKSVATVSSKGVVKGVKAGTTKITVTSKKNTKKKATITVKVTKVPVTKVKVSQSSASLDKGNTLTLKATVTAKSGAVKTVGWKSSNTKVATVSSKGVVTAVGAGTATITAQAIDGSGKKATCKVTVSDRTYLTGMSVLNSYTISFSLSKAQALSASQVSVALKTSESGSYRGVGKVETLSTNDSVNYTLILDTSISQGTFVQLSIPSLSTSMEQQYIEPVCAFTGDEVCTGTVGSACDYWMYFDNGYGYSQFTITGLPAGLSAEQNGYYIEVSGTPTTAGLTTATLTAVDEIGNTLTRNICFAIGSDTKLAGAAVPYYTLSSDNSSVGTYVYCTGGSGSYKYEIISDPKGTGAYISGRYIYGVSLKVAGDYTITVRVTDTNNASLTCDIPVVFHAAQGVSIGGTLKDAQGNPMSTGYVSFTNKNRADRYFTGGTFYVNSDTGVYSALVSAGTYDIVARISRSSDAASAATYLTSQSLTATRTGYDFTLPLYKVALSWSSDYSSYLSWYIDGEYVGYGKTLYLKSGSYKLESEELSSSSSSNASTTGDWFNGSTTTTTISNQALQLTANVNVASAAVQVAATAVSLGNTSSSYSYTYPAAKDTDSELLIDAGTYSFTWTDVYDGNGDWYDDVQQALYVNVETTGSYILDSSYGYVNLYDTSGTIIEPASTSGTSKTYENLSAGTYIIGTGDYTSYDYDISLSTAVYTE